MALKRRAWAIAVVPLAVVLTVFAIANRHEATVDLWPMPMTATVPVFLLTLGALGLGLLLGAILFWIPLASWRSRARRREKRIAELEAALEQSNQRNSADAALPLTTQTR